MRSLCTSHRSSHLVYLILSSNGTLQGIEFYLICLWEHCADLIVQWDRHAIKRGWLGVNSPLSHWCSTSVILRNLTKKKKKEYEKNVASFYSSLLAKDEFHQCISLLCQTSSERVRWSFMVGLVAYRFEVKWSLIYDQVDKDILRHMRASLALLVRSTKICGRTINSDPWELVYGNII